MDATLAIGGTVRFDAAEDSDAARRITETVGQLLQVKNLAVLIGSGASLHLGGPSIRSVSASDIATLATAAGVEMPDGADAALSAFVQDDRVDLEELLASLTSALAYARSIGADEVQVEASKVTCETLRLLRRAVNHSLAVACDLPTPERVTDERYRQDPWLAHREFFRRLLRSRRSDLPRVRVFTTNYDLVIERTLDDAGIAYFDGFVGTVDRVMRLETYQQDLYLPPQGDERRLVRIPNVLYLYKLHGSVNWRSSTSPAGFGTRQVVQSAQPLQPDDDLALIFPTPHKESDVLGHPYADLLRTLSTTLSVPETAIMLVGYGFADEHINRLLLQALPSNPTLQVLIVDPYEVVTRDEEGNGVAFAESVVGRLAQIPDQRIAVLTGDDVCFTKLAEVVMPDPDDFAVEHADSLAGALEDAVSSGPEA